MEAGIGKRLQDIISTWPASRSKVDVLHCDASVVCDVFWSMTDVGGDADSDVIMMRRLCGGNLFEDVVVEGGADNGGTDVEMAGRNVAAWGDDRAMMWRCCWTSLLPAGADIIGLKGRHRPE